MIWTQHLLGIGHLKRAAVLARATSAAGADVTLVSGGFPVSDLDIGGASLVQLPLLRAMDSSFSGLATKDGTPPDPAFLRARRDQLLSLFAQTQPDVLVTEMYPFGRRQLAFELEPLLEAARASGHCAIICSVRDILTAKKKRARYDEMADVVLGYYDSVLVHGDPTLIPFDVTFPAVARIAHLIHYTGYVRESHVEAPHSDASNYDVVVSAGGGAVGDALLEAALTARPKSTLAASRWLLLAGATRSDDEIAQLRNQAPNGVDIERSRADFQNLLRHARVSISQAGYNTVMDIVDTRVSAILVPFVGDGETEQTTRATRMSQCGLAQVVTEHELAGPSLANAIDRALLAPAPPDNMIDCDGADASAAIIMSHTST